MPFPEKSSDFDIVTVMTYRCALPTCEGCNTQKMIKHIVHDCPTFKSRRRKNISCANAKKNLNDYEKEVEKNVIFKTIMLQILS